MAIPAMAGLAIMEFPGDAYQSYAPAGSFVGYQNSNTVLGDPQNAQEINNMLHSTFRTGITFPNSAIYSHINMNVACDSAYMPTDQRFVIASNDLSFAAGQTRKFASALVTADSAGGCPGPRYENILEVADTAYRIYWHPFRYTPGGAQTGVSAIQGPALRIYPNPATSTLHVVTGGRPGGRLQVYDVMGKSVLPPLSQTATGFDLNTAALPAGVYTIRYQSNTLMRTGIFVKE
jgi:hypothetical protein